METSITSTVNAGLTSIHWYVGNRIRREILQEARAEYGRSIVVSLSRQLILDYGNGFAEKNLRKMMQCAEVFSDEQIVASLMRQLSWTHFVTLIPLHYLEAHPEDISLIDLSIISTCDRTVFVLLRKHYVLVLLRNFYALDCKRLASASAK